MAEERMNAAEIAGHCNEVTAWKILREVSEQWLAHPVTGINPYRILIDESDLFCLAEVPETEHQVGFDAPEALKGSANEASQVWSLAASVFFIVMGRQIMNGKGGTAQHERSKLPYMRSEWPELSELIQNCLQFNPILRPSMKDLHTLAKQRHDICIEMVKQGPRIQHKASTDPSALKAQDQNFWPEAMTPDMTK